MSLLDIKHHLEKVKLTSLGSLCILFKADAQRVRCMVQHFINKGQVRKCLREPDCGSKCFKCPVETMEMYEWVGAANL